MLLIGTAPIGGPIDGAIADVFGARAPLLLGGIAALGAALGVLAARARTALHGDVTSVSATRPRQIT